MTFQIVTFLKYKDEVDIVPAAWTFTKNGVIHTYYPPLRDHDAIKAVAKAEDPPNKSRWGKYAVRVLHSFDTYEQAEENLAHFYENSDFGSVRTPALALSSQSNTRSKSSSPESVPSKFQLSLPTLPSSRRPTVKETPMQSISRSSSSSPESVPPKFQLALPTLPSKHRPTVRETPKSRPAHERCNVPTETNSFELQHYMDKKFKELEVSLGRKLVELERQQHDMIAVLEELRGTMQTIPSKITTIQNWKDQGLPFTTYDSLIDFDTKLEANSKLRQDLVLWLSRSGGNTVAEAVNAMLSKIMTDDVALKLTFYGTATKSAFQSLNLKDAIYEAVVLVLADTDEKHFRMKVQSFLDHASDRIKAKKNAEMKKQKKSAE